MSQSQAVYQSPLSPREIQACRALWDLVIRAHAMFPRSLHAMAMVALVRLNVFFRWRATAVLLAANSGTDIEKGAATPTAHVLVTTTAQSLSRWLDAMREEGCFPEEFTAETGAQWDRWLAEVRQLTVSAPSATTTTTTPTTTLREAEAALDHWVVRVALPRLRQPDAAAVRFANPRPVDEFYVREMQAHLRPFPAPVVTAVGGMETEKLGDAPSFSDPNKTVSLLKAITERALVVKHRTDSEFDALLKYLLSFLGNVRGDQAVAGALQSMVKNFDDNPNLKEIMEDFVFSLQVVQTMHSVAKDKLKETNKLIRSLVNSITRLSNPHISPNSTSARKIAPLLTEYNSRIQDAKIHRSKLLEVINTIENTLRVLVTILVYGKDKASEFFQTEHVVDFEKYNATQVNNTQTTVGSKLFLTNNFDAAFTAIREENAKLNDALQQAYDELTELRSASQINDATIKKLEEDLLILKNILDRRKEPPISEAEKEISKMAIELKKYEGLKEEFDAYKSTHPNTFITIRDRLQKAENKVIRLEWILSFINAKLLEFNEAVEKRKVTSNVYSTTPGLIEKLPIVPDEDDYSQDVWEAELKETDQVKLADELAHPALTHGSDPSSDDAAVVLGRTLGESLETLGMHIQAALTDLRRAETDNKQIETLQQTIDEVTSKLEKQKEESMKLEQGINMLYDLALSFDSTSQAKTHVKDNPFDVKIEIVKSLLHFLQIGQDVDRVFNEKNRSELHEKDALIERQKDEIGKLLAIVEHMNRERTVSVKYGDMSNEPYFSDFVTHATTRLKYATGDELVDTIMDMWSFQHDNDNMDAILLKKMMEFSKRRMVERAQYLMPLRMTMKTIDTGVFRNERRMEAFLREVAPPPNAEDKIFMRIYAVMFAADGFWSNKVRRVLARIRHFFSSLWRRRKEERRTRRVARREEHASDT